MSSLVSIDYRWLLVSLCRKNNWYMVNYLGNFIHQFCIFRRDGDRLNNEIYTAIFESFYDLVLNDIELYRINVGDCEGWESVFNNVMSCIKEEEKVIIL